MKISLRRCHTLIVEDGAFSHKLDFIANLEGHTNHITGSRVTAALLNGCILSIGGASAMAGLRSTGLPRLVRRHICIIDPQLCSIEKHLCLNERHFWLIVARIVMYN